MLDNWFFCMTTYAHLLPLPYKQKSRQMRQLISGFFLSYRLRKIFLDLQML